MARIDLDDLPPRIAKMFTSLTDGEEVMIVQGGAVLAHLTARNADVPPTSEEPTTDAEMAEILEHFASIIDDEF